MIKFKILTLFPDFFNNHQTLPPFKKGLDIKAIEINTFNIRDMAVDSYKTVDDKSYGGGVGMVMMIEPIYKTLEKVYSPEIMKRFIEGDKNSIPQNHKIVVLSPRGSKFDQSKAREFAKCDQITFICGRYEGIDARVENNLSTDVISIGNFVLSGGETPALAIMESVTRLMPGILEKEEATYIESFSDKDSSVIEYSQFTRPEEFMGIKVPEVLLSGNHAEIKKWRESIPQ